MHPARENPTKTTGWAGNWLLSWERKKTQILLTMFHPEKWHSLAKVATFFCQWSVKKIIRAIMKPFVFITTMHEATCTVSLEKKFLCVFSSSDWIKFEVPPPQSIVALHAHCVGGQGHHRGWRHHAAGERSTCLTHHMWRRYVCYCRSQSSRISFSLQLASARTGYWSFPAVIYKSCMRLTDVCKGFLLWSILCKQRTTSYFAWYRLGWRHGFGS